MFSYTPRPSQRQANDVGCTCADSSGADDLSLEEWVEVLQETVRARGADVTREEVITFVVGKMLASVTPGEEKALRAKFGFPTVPELEDVEPADWQVGLSKLRAFVA